MIALLLWFTLGLILLFGVRRARLTSLPELREPADVVVSSILILVLVSAFTDESDLKLFEHVLNDSTSVFDVLEDRNIRPAVLGYFLALIVYFWSIFERDKSGHDAYRRYEYLGTSRLYMIASGFMLVFSILVLEAPKLISSLQIVFNGSSFQIGLRKDIGEELSKLEIAPPDSGYVDRIDRPDILAFDSGRIERDINYICVLSGSPIDHCNSFAVNQLSDMLEYKQLSIKSIAPMIKCIQENIGNDTSSIYSISHAKYILGDIPYLFQIINQERIRLYAATKEERDSLGFDRLKAAEENLIRGIASIARKIWFKKLKEASRDEEMTDVCIGMKELINDLNAEFASETAPYPTQKRMLCENVNSSRTKDFCRLLELGRNLPYGAHIESSIASALNEKIHAEQIYQDWIEGHKKYIKNRKYRSFYNIRNESDRISAIKSMVILMISESFRNLKNGSIKMSPKLRIQAIAESTPVRDILHMFRPDYFLGLAHSEAGCLKQDAWLRRLHVIHFSNLNHKVALLAAAAGELVDHEDAIRRMNVMEAELSQFTPLKECFQDAFRKIFGSDSSILYLSAQIIDTRVMAGLARLRFSLKERNNDFDRTMVKKQLNELRANLELAALDLQNAIQVSGQEYQSCSDIQRIKFTRSNYERKLSNPNSFEHACNMVSARISLVSRYFDAIE